MPRDIVYFDLETQRTANDAGGWNRKGNMRMSIGVTYSTKTVSYEVFSEARVNELIERLRRADLVVGFNVLNFDYHVLMGYTVLDLAQNFTRPISCSIWNSDSVTGSASTRSRMPLSVCKKPLRDSMRFVGGGKVGSSKSPNTAASM